MLTKKKKSFFQAGNIGKLMVLFSSPLNTFLVHTLRLVGQNYFDDGIIVKPLQKLLLRVLT